MAGYIIDTSVDNAEGPYAFRNEYGSTAIWIGFALSFFSSAVFFLLSYLRNVKPEARLMYYLVTTINIIMALSYLIMGLNENADSDEDYSSQLTHNEIRTFEWVRYAAWAAELPIFVYVLGLLAGAHWVETVWSAAASVVYIAALYAATISAGEFATWPLFAFAVVMAAVVGFALIYNFRSASYKVHPEVGKLYSLLAFASFLAGIGYIITWGCSEGGYVTTQDQEIIVYTVLDIFTKVIFGFVLLWSREAIARYGTFLGVINSGVDFDFPIARSTYTGSASNYAVEPSPEITSGVHRDIAFAQLRAIPAAPVKVVAISQEVRDRQSL